MSRLQNIAMRDYQKQYSREMCVLAMEHCSLRPKSPSARGLVACLPVRLLFKSI